MSVTTLDSQDAGAGAFAASLLGLAGLVVALPIVLLAGAPLWGWMLGAGLWLANWSVQLLTGRISLRISAPAAVGVSGISFMARAWLVAILLFVVALRFSQEAALAAAGVFLAAFTFDLVGRAILFGLTQQRRDERDAEDATPEWRGDLAASGSSVRHDPPGE